ncbi:SLC45 family MFS transporter [Diaminobutyricibacter tongyongensis]|uniref:SLC45 family MFS transporter n=1 Tax=Leifsonia tongyongensis TaxID=1268043 RepID=A0A6L9XVV6_9MICO|nr:MFS transporter [Diaminobutyricibacter tongyongensis]NEN05347.1 SLC45 family MFS transporter [Diaminobutyricibacter tongyongensis]
MTIPPISLEAADSPSNPVAFDHELSALPKQRALLWTMFVANLGMATLWGAIGSIFLAVQLQTLNPDNKVGSLSLAIGLGAIGAMVASPIAGTLSDRTRTRIGGRAPWMIGGLGVAVAATVYMGFATSTIELIIAFVVVQVGTSFVASPLIAHIPDRVPSGRRGVFSSINGLGTLIGSVVGQAVGAAFSGSIPLGYIAVAVTFGVAIGVFLIVNAGQSNVGVPREPFAVTDLLRTFWVNPIKYPDFFWAFTGRLLIITGYYLVGSFGLYILQDYIGLGAGAVSVVPIVGVCVLVGIISSTIIAGPLSDRIGRRKIFIFIASAVLAVSILIPFVWPSVAGMLTFAFLSGFGFGAYQAVDYALVTQVLPSKENAGRDLGIINITATLPQTFGVAVAGLIVVLFGGYAALFPIAAAITIVGAVAIIPIRSVR